MLHELHQHWSFAAFNIEKTFDAQQIGPPQLHQCIHRTRENAPRHRRRFGHHEAADTVTVVDLSHERVALVRRRLDQTSRINFAVDRLQNLGAGIELV